MENAAPSVVVEAVVLIKRGNKYAFFNRCGEDSQLCPLSLQMDRLGDINKLDSIVRQLVDSRIKAEVTSISVVSVEVGHISGDDKDSFGLRLVTLATVDESIVVSGNIDSSSKAQWMQHPEIARVIDSKPQVLLRGMDIFRWTTLCEGDPTHLALSAVVNLAQGFVPTSCPPVREQTDGLVASKGKVTIESREEELLRKSKIGPVELSQIASEFNAHCGSGAKRMKRDVFASFVSKIGISPNAVDNLYRAFGGNDGGLTLQQIQVGVAAMEPATPHGGICGQVRAEMIFKYYNKRENGSLNLQEFRNLLSEIYSIKNVTLSQEALEKLTVEQFKLFELTADEEITLSSFLSSVGQLKFRGTSSLLRLTNHVFGPKDDHTSDRPPSPIHIPPDHDSNSDSVSDKKIVAPSPNNGENQPRFAYTGRRKALSMEIPEEMDVSYAEGGRVALREGGPKKLKLDKIGKHSSQQSEEFSIATHFVKVRRNGLLVDVSTLWDFISTEAVTGSVRNILSHSRPGLQRQGSLFAFDPKSSANQMLGMLRYFEQNLSPENSHEEEKAALSWGTVSMEDVAKKFLALCSRVQDILAQEERLVHLEPPVYVLGDFHGNFPDLVRFEKVLWRLGPPLTPATFLFLGDYVDRGPYGFEVVAYLFAQKVLAPHKMILIRGNHELREMQLNFSFQQECFQKFGQVLGGRVWETINLCFDVMPISAVVDDKIFCTHGGIPRPCHGGGLLSAIREAPIILTDPESQCPLAWELMWSDPIRGEELSKDLAVELRKNDGFIPNPSRGTGYLFSGEALQAFLQRNNLSHVIRAHEVKATGFQLQHKGRLLTVFSSSGYCGGTNEAACVLIEGRKIRTIRLDTT